MTERDEVAWLRGSLGDDARRPLLFSSAKFGSCHHSDFWSLSADIDDFRPLVEALLPRQGAAVMITDTQPDSHRRHFVGLQLAALLAERGRRVVLVDAEREQEGFSRSLEDPEREGWFDLILYGASPSATVSQAPLVGLRLLSVGSVLPSAGEILDANGIQRGLTQLKHEFDCVLLLRSAGTDRDEWTELFEHCDGVFLLAASEDPEGERLVQWLGEKKIPLWGGAVFGRQTVNVDLAIEGTFSEPEPTPDAPAAAPKSEAAPASGPATAPDMAGAKASEDAMPKPAARPQPSEPPPVAEEVEPNASSPVFRNVTLALVVALAAFVGWWAWSQREPSPVDPISSSLPPVSSLESGSEPELDGAGPADSNAVELQRGQEDVALEASASEEVEEEPAAAGELATTEQSQDAVQIEQETPSGPSNPPAEERPAETVEATPAPRRTPPPAQSSDRTTGADPLLADVGSGWALHPWSFPDSNEALSAIGPLIRRGMKPAVRGFVLEERGRWYRVLVGSFPTRALAMDARERLTEVRGIDWVGVVRVP